MSNNTIQVDYNYLNQVQEHLGVFTEELRNLKYFYVYDIKSTISANKNSEEACEFATDILTDISSLLEMDRDYVRRYGIEFGELDSELLP